MHKAAANARRRWVGYELVRFSPPALIAKEQVGLWRELQQRSRKIT